MSIPALLRAYLAAVVRSRPARLRPAVLDMDPSCQTPRTLSSIRVRREFPRPIRSPLRTLSLR